MLIPFSFFLYNISNVCNSVKKLNNLNCETNEEDVDHKKPEHRTKYHFFILILYIFYLYHCFLRKYELICMTDEWMDGLSRVNAITHEFRVSIHWSHKKKAEISYQIHFFTFLLDNMHKVVRRIAK